MNVKKRLEVYKCNICGNIVEVLNVGGGELVCCGKPMQLLEEKTSDIGKEKHVPVIEKEKDKIIIRIGSVPHPMEKEHYIQWIEMISDESISIKFLKPGEKPEAVFEGIEKDVKAREYCNLHGLWRA